MGTQHCRRLPCLISWALIFSASTYAFDSSSENTSLRCGRFISTAGISQGTSNYALEGRIVHSFESQPAPVGSESFQLINPDYAAFEPTLLLLDRGTPRTDAVLLWSQVPGFATYVIYRNTVPDAPFPCLAHGIANPVFVDPDVPQHIFFYLIGSQNACGRRSGAGKGSDGSSHSLQPCP